MDRAEFIETEFDSYIKDRFPNVSVQTYLLNHPRKELCLQRLREQFLTIEGARLQSVDDPKRFKQTVRQLAHAIAEMFCKNAIQKAEEDAVSYAEKMRRTAEASALEDMTQMIEDETKAFEDGKLHSYPGMTTEQAK